MARAVGIDIGSKSLKILQLETSSNKVRVTHFSDLELYFGEDEQVNSNLLIEAIDKIFKESSLDRSNVILSLPTQDAILREITVNFSQDDHIKKIIKYEAEKYLHSYPIEQVIIDYEKINTDEGKSRLFVAAVPKVILSQRLGILETCNVDPISVDLDITAVANVAALSPVVMKHEMVLIIDFGASGTKLIFMNKNNLKHVRAIRLGANIIDDDFAGEGIKSGPVDGEDDQDDIDWDLEGELIVTLPVPDGIISDRMFLVHQTDENVNHQQRKSEVFDRLVKEIRRTMMNSRLKNPIEKICLTGGGSQLQGISKFLEENLKVKTELLDFSSNVILDNDISSEVFYTGSVAIGCALKGLGKHKIDMDFRKEEYAYAKRFEMIKVSLAFLVTMFLLLVSVMAYSAQSQRMSIEKKYNLLAKRAEKIHKRALPTKRLPSRNNKFIQRVRKNIENKVYDTEGVVPEIKSAFVCWKDIFNEFAHVRKNTKIIITEVSIEENQCSISGFLEADDAPLDQLRRRINNVPNVDPKKTTFVRNEISENSPVRELPREYTVEFSFKNDEDDE